MRLGEQECEIGLGLHNEPGVTRKKMQGPTSVIREMLELVLHSRDDGDDFWAMSDNKNLGDEGVLFVNNVGGARRNSFAVGQVPFCLCLSIYLILNPESMRICPTRIYLSSYMTSLNTPGFSISLLNTSSVQGILQRDLNWTSPIEITELIDYPSPGLVYVRSGP